LKPKCDELVSNYAFNLNLRFYTEAKRVKFETNKSMLQKVQAENVLRLAAGAHTRSLLSST